MSFDLKKKKLAATAGDEPAQGEAARNER